MAKRPGLSWGALDFVSPHLDPPEEGFVIYAMANGTTFGNPEADYQTLQSLLRDGAVVVRGNRRNRLVTIRLAVSSPSAHAGIGLVAGEAALANQVEMDAPPPLAATPALTDAATAFFDVVIAHDLEWDTSDGWDLDEVLRDVWYFTLTLECLPFPRTENKVVVPALPVPVDPEEPAVWDDLDTCDSTSGWVRSVYPTVDWMDSIGVVSGAVRATLTYSGGGSGTDYYPGCALQRNGPLAMAGLPYLVVDAKVSHPSVYAAIFYQIDGAPAAPVATQVLGDGTLRAWLATSGVATKLRVGTANALLIGPPSPAARWVEVSNIARTNAIGDTTDSTTRQQSRLVEVRGSAPTQAAVRLFDATPAALGGEILVHASANAVWQPPLRRWRVAGAAVTADSAMVSGGRNTLASAMVFRIPGLLTERTYALRARMNITTGGTLGWSVKIVDAAGANVVGSSLVTSGSREIATTGGAYRVVEVADLGLVMGKPEGEQMVQLTITGTADMSVDEMWLFGLDDGVLTWLRDAEGMSWIEIRSAVLGAEKDAIYGGIGTPGVGGVDVTYKAGGDGYGSIGVPEFKPGLWQIFTVTTSSLVSQSEIEFYPRGHSHVLAEWAAS